MDNPQWHFDTPAITYRCGGSTGITSKRCSPVSRLTKPRESAQAPASLLRFKSRNKQISLESKWLYPTYQKLKCQLQRLKTFLFDKLRSRGLRLRPSAGNLAAADLGQFLQM
jgi:hypothetical protein